MKSLFSRLVIYLDNSNVENAYYNIALYIVNNFSQIRTMTINELATNCYVSSATISRFCKMLGYENYTHFKQECILNETREGLESDKMYDDFEKFTKNYSKSVSNEISKLSSVVEWDIIDKTLQVIYESNSVVFFEEPLLHFLSLYFQMELLTSKKSIKAPIELNKQFEFAKSLTNKDTAVIIDDDSKDCYVYNNFRIIQYLKKSGCKIILISNQQYTNLKVDYQIKLNIDANKYSLLVLIEMMIFRYHRLFGKLL